MFKDYFLFQVTIYFWLVAARFELSRPELCEGYIFVITYLIWKKLD